MTGTEIEVIIMVRIGDETKTFDTSGSTTADPYEVIGGLLQGTRNAADAWINDQLFQRGR